MAIMQFPRVLNSLRHVSPILPRQVIPLPLSSPRYLHPSRPYSHQRPQCQITNIIGSPQVFFRYVSGRWLWDEKQQLAERYRESDIRFSSPEITICCSSSNSLGESHLGVVLMAH